jgi:hypothetical protein
LFGADFLFYWVDIDHLLVLFGLTRDEFSDAGRSLPDVQHVDSRALGPSLPQTDHCPPLCPTLMPQVRGVLVDFAVLSTMRSTVVYCDALCRQAQ